MLKNLIIGGGSAMIMKEIADRVRQVRVEREKTLRRKQAGILALGITLGGAVGAVAGILFAPRAGKEIREDLGRRGSETWGKLKENAANAGNELVSVIEAQSSRVRTAAEKGVVAAKGALKAPPVENEGADKQN
ncbi:MAG: YtxH domain-containing protein [Syntrophobacteraceae bacterium]